MSAVVIPWPVTPRLHRQPGWSVARRLARELPYVGLGNEPPPESQPMFVTDKVTAMLLALAAGLGTAGLEAAHGAIFDLVRAGKMDRHAAASAASLLFLAVTEPANRL